MVPHTGCNPRGSNAHHEEIRTGITDWRSTDRQSRDAMAASSCRIVRSY